jgi:hypothetical protein
MPELETEELKTCKQPECPVRTSGKCLEGLEPESCSHFYWSDGETAQNILPNEDQSKANLIKLFSGTELNLKELGLVTHEYPTNLVIVIGESSSGKSTILTSVFDMFQVGKFKQFYFAGSYTQYGFESRCHLSRADSGLIEPDTAHTLSIEFNFLHIAYKHIDSLSGRPHHLLLSDISGERFNMALNSSSMMKEMDLMQGADHLVYLLDGEKIADKYQRNAIITRAGQFITRALDNGLFDNSTDLIIIFTKCDLLGDLQADGTIEKIKKTFIDRYGSRMNSLNFETIAARPKPATTEIPFGHGLEILLSSWSQKKSPTNNEAGGLVQTTRYFESYSLKNV